MIEEIEKAMILYTKGNKIKHDVAHFLKVHQYARLIGQLEHLEKREQDILEVAAIVHDIACPMCREKYGHCAGNLQEKEGPALVKEVLKDFSLDHAFVERVCYLVGHHHTYQDVDGLDYQILLEADFLVNADESNLKKEAIEKMKINVFKTKTGKELLNHIYEL